jgi:hypothetical protein
MEQVDTDISAQSGPRVLFGLEVFERRTRGCTDE